MAKREPKAHTPCDHPVANWVTAEGERRLVCRQCAEPFQKQFLREVVPLGVLYKGPDGLYGPRGWLM